MVSRNKENLEDLFSRFLSAQEARQSAEDVRKGEDLLRQCPAPEPDRRVVADIKAQVAQALQRPKTNNLKRVVYKAAAVAAAVVILATISVKLSQKSNGVRNRRFAASIIPQAIWESNDIALDDPDLAALTAQLEQIEEEVLAVQLNGNGGNGPADLEELEIELIEIDSDFWKG